MPTVVGSYLELNVGLDESPDTNAAYLELNVAIDQLPDTNAAYLEINVAIDQSPDTTPSYLEMNVIQHDTRLHQFSTAVLASGTADARLHQFSSSVLARSSTAEARLQQFSVSVLTKEIQVQLQAGVWSNTIPISLRNYIDAVLADNPVAYWRLNETTGATTAIDSSGNGYNGTYAGTPTFEAAGIAGSNAVTFDKVDDHVSVSANAAFYPTASNSLAYELWYKGTDVGTDTNWSGWAGLFAANASISNKKFAIGIDSNGHAAGLADDQYASIASTTAINDGNWHHIVFTVAASSYNTALWVDGVNEASSSTPDDPGSGAPTLYIGYFERSGIRVAGEIDEVAIYSSGSGDALPSGRIAAHYAAGST